MLRLSLTSLLLLLVHLSASTASHVPVEFGSFHNAHLRGGSHVKRVNPSDGNSKSVASRSEPSKSVAPHSIAPHSKSPMSHASHSASSAVSSQPVASQAPSSGSSPSSPSSPSSASDTKFCQDQNGVETKCIVIAGVAFIVVAGVYFTVKAWRSLKADQANAAELLDSPGGITPKVWSQLNNRVQKLILENADASFQATVEAWSINGYIPLTGQAGVDYLEKYLADPTAAEFSRGDIPARLAAQWQSLDADTQQKFLDGYAGEAATFQTWTNFDLAADAARSGIAYTAVAKAPPAAVQALQNQGAQPVEQPAVQPVEQPAVQPVEQPAVQPVEQPAVQPVEQPAVQPVDQPFEQPQANQPIAGGSFETKTQVWQDFLNDLKAQWSNGDNVPKDYYTQVDAVTSAYYKAVTSNPQVTEADMPYYNGLFKDIQEDLRSGTLVNEFIKGGVIPQPVVQMDGGMNSGNSGQQQQSSETQVDLEWNLYEADLWAYESGNGGIPTSQQSLAEDASTVLSNFAQQNSLDQATLRTLQSRMAQSIQSGSLEADLKGMGEFQEQPSTGANNNPQDGSGKGQSDPTQQQNEPQQKSGTDIIDGTISGQTRGSTQGVIEGQENNNPTGQTVEVEPVPVNNGPEVEGSEPEE